MNSKKYKNVLYKTRYINDLRDMIYSSAEIFGSKPAFLVKDVPGGKYRPITYIQLKEDINDLGTRLIDMELKGKKIAVIGENSYKWVGHVSGSDQRYRSHSTAGQRAYGY